MERIRDRVAGLDVHRDRVVACVRADDGSRVKTLKRSFSMTTAGTAELAAWLADQEVGTAAMEATGVYWKPVYYGTAWTPAGLHGMQEVVGSSPISSTPLPALLGH